MLSYLVRPSGEEFEQRQRKLLEKEEFYERRRAVTYQREESRWDKIEMEHRFNQEAAAELLASDKSKRNSSSVAYNPITLKYDETYNVRKRSCPTAGRHLAPLARATPDLSTLQLSVSLLPLTISKLYPFTFLPSPLITSPLIASPHHSPTSDLSPHRTTDPPLTSPHANRATS
jgi:hypothetical protein